MSRHQGRHAKRVPAETRPDRTAQPSTVTLLNPATIAGRRPGLKPAPLPVPAPVHGPVFLPPLMPAPPPMPAPSTRPRAAWAPARPPAPRAPAPITEAAVLARDPDGRIPSIFTIRCGCRRVHTTGGTRSFPDLHAAARLAGWRTDTFGTWACPACQQQPGYRPANMPVPVNEAAEHALMRDVADAAGPDWQLRDAARSPRVFLDASKLEAVTA